MADDHLRFSGRARNPKADALSGRMTAYVNLEREYMLTISEVPQAAPAEEQPGSTDVRHGTRVLLPGEILQISQMILRQEDNEF